MSKNKDEFIQKMLDEMEKFTREATNALNKLMSVFEDASNQDPDPDKLKEIERDIKKFRERMEDKK